MIAAHALNRHFGPLVRRYLARPFSRGKTIKLLLCYSANRISFSQAYPFLYYAGDFQDRFGAELRAVPVEGLLKDGQFIHSSVDLIILQPSIRNFPNLSPFSYSRYRLRNTC